MYCDNFVLLSRWWKVLYPALLTVLLGQMTALLEYFHIVCLFHFHSPENLYNMSIYVLAYIPNDMITLRLTL